MNGKKILAILLSATVMMSEIPSVYAADLVEENPLIFADGSSDMETTEATDSDIFSEDFAVSEADEYSDYEESSPISPLAEDVLDREEFFSDSDGEEPENNIFTDGETSDENLFSAGENETINKSEESLSVIDTNSFLTFGKAISTMIKEKDTSSVLRAAVSDDFALRRLIVKSKGSELDFSEYNAEVVIKGPKGYYIVQFKTEEDTKSAMNLLNKQLIVEYAEPDKLVFQEGDVTLTDGSGGEEIDSTESNSWGVSRIHADTFAEHVKSTTSGSAVVAVVDSGVDASHPFLAGRVLSGYDFEDNDSDPYDENGHGTHVSGTIVDCTPGLNVKILPVRVMDARGEGYSSVIGTGVAYAADTGADVINMSLGGGHSYYKDDNITYAINKGVSVVVSAGNDNRNTENYCPAHMTDAIVVAAIDSDETKAYFSNYGTSVDVAAPGVGILSCVPGGGYESWDGTSMAAPHVSALVAMLGLVYPNYTPGQLENTLKSYTRDLGDPGFDIYYGYGIPDMSLFGSNPVSFYRISYDANGGSNAPSDQTKQSGSALILSGTIPERFGYDFLGWATSSSALSASYLPGGTFNVDADTTLYAVWKKAAVISSAGPSSCSVSIDIAGSCKYYQFTPNNSGIYTFESTGDYDTHITLYSSGGTQLALNDDGGADRNFLLSYDMTAGTTYYLKVKCWYSEVVGTFDMSVKGAFALKSISKYTAELSYISATYTGVGRTPGVTVKNGNAVLRKNTDYTVNYINNVNAGTATVEIQGIGNYTGILVKAFVIKPKSINELNGKLSYSSAFYTGIGRVPEVILEYSGMKLQKGKDYTVVYSNNVNVGTATAVVTGKGNYAGTVKFTFTIKVKPMSDLAATLSYSSAYYTGVGRVPAMTIKNGNITLQKEKDYTLKYTNNVNVGKATVTATGKGNYTGTLVKTFEIKPKPIADLTATLSYNSAFYTGIGRVPAMTIKYGNITLQKGKDYTLTYSNNVNAGKATVTAIGKGNYTGRLTKSFTVKPKSIEGLTATLSYSSAFYTGIGRAPGVTVKDGNTVLQKGKDYTVTYLNNVNVGTATAVVTGIGNYAGTLRKTFTIKVKTISDLSATLSYSSAFYTGIGRVPTMNIKYGDITLQKGTDYTLKYSNNVNVGKATVTATGKGNYTGTLAKTFDIRPKPVSDLTATLSYNSALYTGIGRVPAVTVKHGDLTLQKGRDYTVSYINNVNVGTASAVISGIGNYIGTLRKPFTIKPKSISDLTATLSYSSALYTGIGRVPKVTVKNGETTLQKGKDYTVSYNDNVNVGTATVTVAGTGNYTGTLIKRFTVKAKPITDLIVTLSYSSTAYTGSALTPVVTAENGNKMLVKGTDYTVTYSNNVNIGTATVTITGKGNYAGEVKRTFQIIPATPVISSVTNPAGGQIRIQWGNVAQKSGYEVQYSKSSGFTDVTSEETAGNTILITGVDRGSTYYIRIRAYKTISGIRKYSAWCSTKNVLVS